MVDSSSGIHPRYSNYYIRTVRADKSDPLAKFLREQGVPVEDDVTKPEHTDVFSFVVESPAHARLAKDVSAIEQLEHYKMIRDCWCEHNPSITVYVRDDEWIDVAAWVYKNFDDVCGVSFLPYSDHVYKQAPYQPISKEEFDVLFKQQKAIDWSAFVDASSDTTTGVKELACVSGVCEII